MGMRTATGQDLEKEWNMRKLMSRFWPSRSEEATQQSIGDHSDMEGKVSVLFVCMGNICRSPTAHGVFRKLVEEEGLSERIFIDSAGTYAYHVGSGPDRRAQETARRRGIDISDLRARKVETTDFELFDYILAMDQSNVDELAEIAPAGLEHKVRLFMDFATDMNWSEVPDPYYGGLSGFERVFDMVETASKGLLAEIRRTHLGVETGT